MLRRATLKQLRIFESAARHLHFGRAAAELHLTQPAVSIQLKQLESEVGLPLFEQIGRRMHLTHLGAELLGHARAVLMRLQEADEALAGMKGAGGGVLHIASTTTAEYFTPWLLAEFGRGRAGLKVRLIVNNRDAIIRELAENTVDLAVMGRAPPGLDAVAVPFARHPFAIIASPEHPLARRRRLPLRQLVRETFLIRERGSGTRDAMARAFAAQHFHPASMIEIGPNEAIKQAVMAGMGVGFVSLHTVGLELATARLTVLAVSGTPVMRDWYVLHRARKRLSPAAEAFKAYLIADGAGVIERAMA
jgi:LysR family transcriptional regulator, low CO2-responsive transcriptional regulator